MAQKLHGKTTIVVCIRIPKKVNERLGMKAKSLNFDSGGDYLKAQVLRAYGEPEK